MATVGRCVITFIFPPPLSKCQPGELLLSPRANAQALNFSERRKVWHLHSSSSSSIMVTLRAEATWDHQLCPVQSGPCGAEVFHRQCFHLQPCLPPAPTVSCLESVSITHVDSKLHRFQGNWYVTVWDHGWKCLLTSLFLGRLVISMHIFQCGHLQSRRYKSYRSLCLAVFIVITRQFLVVYFYFGMR